MKEQYKQLHRKYRIAFNSSLKEKNELIEEFWNKYEGDNFAYFVQNCVHKKDYVFLNRLQVFRIWGV